MSTEAGEVQLSAFHERGVLRLERVDGPRHHSAWLDHWLATCATRWAVFVDSDVEFRRSDWLRELVEAAREGDHALVCSEMLAAGPHNIEPVGGKEVYLAPRPAPWLMLIDCKRIRELGISFAFVGEPSDERPEGLIAYDTGAKLFAALQEAGLTWCQMPPGFARGYTHFGNMSWADRFGTSRRHRAKVRRVQRRLRRARRADPS